MTRRGSAVGRTLAYYSPQRPFIPTARLQSLPEDCLKRTSEGLRFQFGGTFKRHRRLSIKGDNTPLIREPANMSEATNSLAMLSRQLAYDPQPLGGIGVKLALGLRVRRGQSFDAAPRLRAN